MQMFLLSSHHGLLVFVTTLAINRVLKPAFSSQKRTVRRLNYFKFTTDNFNLLLQGAIVFINYQQLQVFPVIKSSL